MSEKLLKILLDELKIVRVSCKRRKPSKAIETTVDRLDSVLDGVTCRFCKSELFSVAQKTNPLRDLQNALRESWIA